MATQAPNRALSGKELALSKSALENAIFLDGKRNPKNIGGSGKQIVHTLVERGGAARSNHIANVSGKTLRPIVMQQVSRKSTLMTDTAGGYMQMGKEFTRHEMVDHGADEYVRSDAHCNTVEGYSLS